MILNIICTQKMNKLLQELLKTLGVGGIHSCGKIDFNVPEIFKLDSIKSFDLGQSNLNDIDLIYSVAREKKIPLLRLRPGKDELLSGNIQKRFPTGVSLVYEAGLFDEAKQVVKSYRSLK
ncbi:MAG: hypothetical protein RBS73_10560 [Prolixibacteraceae bacterium]|jgi:hypothetical protein|nr:hypothetical protein [Prolixibacteraceae bacterium]